MRLQPAGKPAAPLVVRGVAALLAVIAVLNVVRAAVHVVTIYGDESWRASSRLVSAVLNGFTVLFSVFVLVLALCLWRGQMWAWITSITLCAVALPWGAIMLLPQLIGGDFPRIGLAILAPALLMLLALTVPGSARGFFKQRPAAVPTAHYQPGPWPAAPGDGNHRPYQSP
ncbi:hypothetical protein OHA21_50915 [Actinoplanes sp. NBC_00393]|uniref:hypothetical protein n=1 Tax=Actinoplanes sp. NBC_00393 TaxID=2975953 RepID=UPI002E2027E3